ncbi:hypothetical protein FRC00_011383 [Tulasnella sp. 408]|nr:hypothetical protein FRC00_011383 [Tulasnella sp. 408]
MSGSKPSFNTRFAARLALQNDTARKANLDAIAALEEFPEEAGENGSMLRAKLPSLANLEPPRGAQTENQASKQETQYAGPDIRNKTSGVMGGMNLEPPDLLDRLNLQWILGLRSAEESHLQDGVQGPKSPATGAAVLSTFGPSNLPSPGLYSQTSNVPVQVPSQSSSNLERMLGAGISPSDEMRRAFGRAVDRILPNVETPETPRTAGIEDNDLDGHISRVAPILATAYSQLVNAGFASPLQLQDVANPFPAPHQSLQRPEGDADPSEISRSGTIIMHNSRKLKLRPPDTGDQPPNVRPGGSLASAPSSRGTSLSSTPNHARDMQLHNGGEQIGTRSKEQNRDHSEHCAKKVNGQGVLRLPKEGTHGAPAAVTVQAETIHSEVGTLESSISNLNDCLAKLERELQTTVFGSSNRPLMTAHVKEQALPTVVLEFLGPLQLTTGRYTFEVALPEAEAAHRWSKRNDSFE